MMRLADGFVDMSVIPITGLNQIILACDSLTKREPAFLDDNAHWVGALVALDKNEDVILIGFPVLKSACTLLETKLVVYDQLNFGSIV